MADRLDHAVAGHAELDRARAEQRLQVVAHRLHDARRLDSGLPGFRVADVIRDTELLESAREEALHVLSKDPRLELPENLPLKQAVETRWKTRLDRLRGGW